jgi:hypothetical protein
LRWLLNMWAAVLQGRLRSCKFREYRAST